MSLTAQHVTQLNTTLTSLVNTDGFEVEEQNTDFYATTDLKERDGWLGDFYRCSTALKLRWRHRNHDAGHVRGDINILPLETVLGSWEGITYYGYPGEPAEAQTFRPFDMMTNESMVGFYDAPDGPSELYYRRGLDPKPLGLDIDGYLRCLSLTRGFFSWQMSIIFLQEGRGGGDHDTLVSTLPVLFEGASFEALEALYNEVRIA